MSLEELCIRVLIAWERTQPCFGTTFHAAHFSCRRYKVQNTEQGLFAKISSLAEYSDGSSGSDVWRAYWITRTHNNCATLASALCNVFLHVARSRGWTHARTLSGVQLELASATVARRAMYPRKTGWLYDGIAKGRIPRTKGDDVWHQFVTLRGDRTIYAVDVACAQYDVFDDELQPFLALPLTDYLSRICHKHRKMPDGAASALGLPYVRDKIINLLDLVVKELPQETGENDAAGAVETFRRNAADARVDYHADHDNADLSEDSSSDDDDDDDGACPVS